MANGLTNTSVWVDQKGRIQELWKIDPSYVYNLYHFMKRKGIEPPVILARRYFELSKFFKMTMPVRNVWFRIVHRGWIR